MIMEYLKRQSMKHLSEIAKELKFRQKLRSLSKQDLEVIYKITRQERLSRNKTKTT